jgi:hypothetical protein
LAEFPENPTFAQNNPYAIPGLWESRLGKLFATDRHSVAKGMVEVVE